MALGQIKTLHWNFSNIKPHSSDIMTEHKHKILVAINNINVKPNIESSANQNLGQIQGLYYYAMIKGN